MNTVLLLKLFLVPGLIYGVSLAGKKWGPSVAGWLSAFPVVAGPILLTIALEQGKSFAGIAAEGTLQAVIAIVVFGLTYAWVSRWFGVFASLFYALALYALAVAGLQFFPLSLHLSFAIVVAILLLAPFLFPAPPAQPTVAETVSSDLPWRMLTGAILVLAVTYSATHLGARLSGFLAMFPVMSTVLVGFSHYHAGRGFVLVLLRGMLWGYFAFAGFCLTLALLLQSQSIALAFCLATAVALLINIVLKYLIQRFRYRKVTSTEIQLRSKFVDAAPHCKSCHEE